MIHPSVHLQMASEEKPSVPNWFGEVAIVAQVLTTSGVFKSIEEQVRFARARFGTYELIDFVAVLIGYAVSAEPTLLTFYERLTPFASAFMALFGRKSLPHRCTLSRYLAALDQPTVEALRALFLDDLVLRTAQTFPPDGLWDRQGQHCLIVDVDGTKQAARQRALPSLPELPTAHRRFDRVCAPAYLAQRALFDWPDLALLPGGPRVRLIVATHPATSTAKPPIGVLRAGTVYELFLTTVPQAAFTCTNVLDLYLHRGSFETVLADEDGEQDPDRWCSHTACGQEFWQILNQWLWNLRLDLGQHLAPSTLRLTEFAPAQEPQSVIPHEAETPLAQTRTPPFVALGKAAA